MKLLLTLFSVFTLQVCFSQVQTYYVPFSDIDSGYFMDDDSSAIVYNSGTQVNKLFIWFGGTNASSSNDYIPLRLLAGGLGFHFINLNYIDTVPAAPLGNDPDSLVFDKFRHENLFGTPLSVHSNVDTFNSIYTRAVKMVQYLAATFPSQNWAQYLATSNTLDWTKIIVGGHSQGSGHACYLAKNFPVDRVLMASGPNDYYNFNNISGHWLRQPGITPVERHYSYLHINDEIVNYYKQYANIGGLGMLLNDDSTFVDNSSPPYNNSHCLYTNQAPGIVILNHNATIKLSTINNDVWTYMLTDLITLNSNSRIEKLPLFIYPNPANNFLNIYYEYSLNISSYKIYSISGKLILSGILNERKINIACLEEGIYFLKVGDTILQFIKL